MSHDPQVFTDPSGKRGKWMIGGLALGLLVVSVLGTCFALTFAAQQTVVRAKPAKVVSDLFPKRPKYTDRTSTRLKQVVHQEALKAQVKAPVRTGKQISLGFYVPWEQASIDSLRENAAHLTHVAPAWLKLGADGTLQTADFLADVNHQEVLDIANENGLKVVPLISNSDDDSFSPEAMTRLLRDSGKADTLVRELIALCRKNGFGGINLDFENVDAADSAAYAGFVGSTAQQFHAARLELSIDVQVGIEPATLTSIGESSDFVVLMAYDEHEESGEAGPIASLGWARTSLTDALSAVAPAKLVLGIGSYAYDWPVGNEGGDSLNYQEAMLTAKGYRDKESAVDVLKFDRASRNAYFDYEDDDGAKRTIWLLDAASAYNQYVLAANRGLAGTALWSLGSEDPGIWSFWGKTTRDPLSIQKSEYGFEVDFEGKGEFLSMLSEPAIGTRKVTVDDQKLISNEVYESDASPTVLKKTGFSPGKIALTFDDGPDPKYTPAILDALKLAKAPAAFFCIGQHIEANQKLVQRIYDEGHEIGNHSYTHPNLGIVSPERSKLEISATQRVIEATLDVSTLLFRPPYNADSQPETQSQVRPVVQAADLGLTTVGESIDPNDWDPTLVDEDGNSRPRTADDIVRLVLDDLAQRKGTSEDGNIVLLHDAGGNREETVEALPVLIARLREKGYELVSLSSLLNKKRADVMPAIPASRRWSLIVDKLVFKLTNSASVALTVCFITAIILGAARTLVILALAIAYRRKKRGLASPGFRPSVTVLIAAYNEETTIASTIQSVLGSSYPLTEIVVIDDGSKDRTGAVATEEFGSHPYVKIISKPNGGKASALNVGIEHATGELLFCIDADTELSTDAIERLVPYFEDASVGAVAGSVEVGNVHNLLTLWQSIEYRTSQNMDRRAYAQLNAITVIPGAIGMWRKSAVVEVGGYESTTLAEDMDLTWKIRRAGYRMETEAGAKAFTEAPDAWGALSKQRSRWAFGTLQCLWKHRSAIGRHGWFGCVVLPLQWVFQVVFQLLGPLVDVQIVVSTIGLVMSLTHKSEEMSSAQPLAQFWTLLGMYALFFALELGAALWACWAEKRRPNDLGWLFLQRFAYRQLMYIVILKSLWRALMGTRQVWGNLLRTGKAIGSSGPTKSA